jgi:hypothetical protein
MSALKIRAFFTGVALITCGAYSSEALAGSTSLLDPYVNVQAPKPNAKQTKDKGKGKAKLRDPEEADSEPIAKSPVVSESSLAKVSKKHNKTSASRPSDENLEETDSAPVAKAKRAKNPVQDGKLGHEERSEISSLSKNAANSGTVIAGLKEISHGYVSTFKAASNGILNGTKKATAKIAGSGKLVKDGLANSGDAMTHGLKATGDKVKASTSAVGGKTHVSNKLPKPVKEEDNDNQAPTVARESQEVTQKQKVKRSDSQVAQSPANFGEIGKPLEPLAPIKHSKPPHIANKNSGVLTGLVSKLNIFGKSKPPMPAIRPAQNTTASLSDRLTTD